MAIDDPNAQGTQTPNERAGTTSNTQRTPPPQQTSSGAHTGIGDLASRRRRLLNKSGHSGALKHFAGMFRELLAEEQLSDAVKVHLLDHEVRMTSLSAIVLSLSEQRGTQRYISTYTFVIEDSGPALPPRQVNIPGSASIEIPTVAGEVINNNMRNKVQALVLSEYGNSGVYMDGGGSVLYREFQPEAQDKRLHLVLYSALESLQNTLQGATKTATPFRLSDFSMDTNRFTAKVDFNSNQELLDAQGMPVRSDFSVTTTGQLTGRVDDMVNGVKRICRIDGYVEPTYHRPQNMVPQYPNAPLPTQHFYSRLVLTNVETDIPDMGIGQMLLAISTAELISRRFLWAGVYRPTHRKGFNPRNLGALALDVPALLDDPTQPDIIDTNAPDFTADDLFKIVSALFHQEVIYSIDIPEAGPESWLTLVFAAAAAGDTEATNRILNAADELTLGNFKKYWQPGGRIIQDDQNRIHLGYWINESGVKEDIRKLDYLAALNMMGKTRLETCRKLANTYDRIDIPWEIRLHDREEIMRGMAPGEVFIKGYASRNSFTEMFVNALINGMRDARFVVAPHNATYMGFADGVIRGNDNLNGLLFSGAGSNGYFNVSQPYSNVNSGFRRGGEFWSRGY